MSADHRSDMEELHCERFKKKQQSKQAIHVGQPTMIVLLLFEFINIFTQSNRAVT